MVEKEKEILEETEIPMDEDGQDFDLEDILKEFSDAQPVEEKEDAQEEEIPVFSSSMTAYELCGKMYALGIGATSKK